MKKILILILAVAMTATMLLTSCVSSDPKETDAPETDAPVTDAPETDAPETDAPETDAPATDVPETDAPAADTEGAAGLLNSVWNAIPEENRFFVGGGNSYNFDTLVQGAPGKFVALEDADYDANMGYPAADVSKIDDAASMFHGMNVNTFTCAAVHFTNADDATAMVETIKNNIMARQWMCGFPEKLVMITADDNYLIYMWGAGDILDSFAAQVTTTVPGATIVVDEPIL